MGPVQIEIAEQLELASIQGSGDLRPTVSDVAPVDRADVNFALGPTAPSMCRSIERRSMERGRTCTARPIRGHYLACVARSLFPACTLVHDQLQSVGRHD